MFHVVGSGPSGIAAAAALLDEGHAVTMLDVGVTRDDDEPGARHETWKPGDLKRAYGSAFAYALDEMRADTQNGTRAVQSFAAGGLSNVWGAAVLPVRARDCEDWPFSAELLTPHYEAVARLMPIAAVHDDLAADFPIHATPQPGLRPSRQAAQIMSTLAAHRTELRDRGVRFGQSRLAVRTVAGGRSPACQYTGLCLTGCPHFAIWTATDALDQLMSRPGFAYRRGFRVDVVRPGIEGHDVVIDGTTSEGRRESITSSRVLLACGPLATARIILRSLKRYDHAVTLRYQPYFLLPMFASRGIKQVEAEALHTLSQVFVEVTDAEVSRYTVHLQLYTYNSFIGDRLRSVTRWLGPLGSPVRDSLAGRVLAVQGYLHSSTAGSITMTARLDGTSERTRLELRAESPPRDAIQRVVRTLWRQRKRIGATPITPLLSVGLPGDGNHCGASFPMRKTPAPLETDMQGQLAELPRVHLVDSSVLPSLPATTFTYTIMANADRIARSVARDELAR